MDTQKTNTGKKKILYLDMDGVVVDFESGIRKTDPETLKEFSGRIDEIPRIFSLMDPMEGAVEAVKTLSDKYDVFILSTAPWNNPSAWADKLEFVKRHFGDLLKKRLIISHRKDLCIGDFLVDDRDKNGASEFTGEWIRFGDETFPSWKEVVQYLLSKA